MTKDEIRAQVLAALGDVAPDIDPTTLADDQPLREQIDIDSYDLLQFLVHIDQRLGVDVPERDYGQIDTLARLIEYLARRLPGSA